MKQTAAKFVSAIFASILASSPLAAAPDEEEKVADKCLLGPSASTPPGGHWYYRVDRANKRNCWYLKQDKENVARKPATEEDAAPTGKPVSLLPKKPVAQRSPTDAHAELPQASVEPDTKVGATQRIPAAPADSPRTDNGQRAGTNEAAKVVTSRWPEPVAAANPPAPPAPAVRAAEAQPQPQPQPQPQAAPAAPPQRPAAPPAQPAKATAAADKPLSLPMLLTVLVGGLSVIGVMASAIFARGKSQRRKSRPTRLSRSAPMPPLQAPEKPLPEEPRAPDDPSQRLQQMLAEIQKRAAA